MRHFCTVADSKFARHIISLNVSLYKFDNNYKLHLLCLDKEIDSIVNHPNIIKYQIDDLLSKDNTLEFSKQNSPSREAMVNANGMYDRAKNIQFIWSLTPYFTHYCLNNISDISDILYVDSDIYFFDNWIKIFDVAADIDIGLVEHRLPFNHDNGKYNVGIVYFKNNSTGKECSELWRNCLLFPNNQYYSKYGDCGDQKYLELFPILFNRVVSFDNYFGHLAPWNLSYHQYTENSIVWMNQIQNLMYYHFSNFKPDFNTNTYIPAPRHGIMDVSSIPLLKKIHDEYFTQLKNAL